MPAYKILPSILSADHGKFVEEALSLSSGNIDMLHIDVMDGHFVPNITFGPAVVASLKKNTPFRLDAHLMIENPDEYSPLFAEAGASIVTVHQEAAKHLNRSLQLIKDHGALAGVSLNPATSLNTIEWVLDQVDLVLVMSVNPGFGGQKFIASSLEKIRKLAALRADRNLNFIIEVDGGINSRTAGPAVAAGADYLVAGNAVFGQKDRSAALRELRKAVDQADPSVRNI